MPLINGRSKKVIGENISEMIAAGHPQKQAVAASLNQARKSGAKIPKKHNKESSMKHDAKKMPRKMMEKKSRHPDEKQDKVMMKKMVKKGCLK